MSLEAFAEPLEPATIETQLRRAEPASPHYQTAWWKETFVQAAAMPITWRQINGPYSQAYADGLAEVHEVLWRVSPEMSTDILMPWGYRDPETEAFIRKQPEWMQRVYSGIREARAERSREVTRQHVEAFVPQTIEPGLLDVPPFAEQKDQRACTLANFRMILGGLTGVHIDEASLQHALMRALESTPTDEIFTHSPTQVVAADELLLKALTTERFKALFQMEPKIVGFTGIDFDKIAQIARRVRAADAASKIFCMLSLESLSAAGIWHNVMLTEVTEKHVYYRDPKMGPSQNHTKQRFVERWGQAYLKGHLVFVESKASELADTDS